MTRRGAPAILTCTRPFESRTKRLREQRPRRAAGYRGFDSILSRHCRAGRLRQGPERSPRRPWMTSRSWSGGPFRLAVARPSWSPARLAIQDVTPGSGDVRIGEREADGLSCGRLALSKGLVLTGDSSGDSALSRSGVASRSTGRPPSPGGLVSSDARPIDRRVGVPGPRPLFPSGVILTASA